MGRSADADDRWLAAPRRDARSAARVLRNSIGVARKPARSELATFEHAIRNDLNMRVPRVMCVANPLKLVLTNYPEGKSEELDASYYPHDVPLTGSRKVPFSREIYIERDDFMENPPKKFFRLAPGREVRLRYGYFCHLHRRDQRFVGQGGGAARGPMIPRMRGGDSPDGRKVQGTSQWVSASHALDCTLRLYDKLFTVPDPDDVPEGQDFLSVLNPESLVAVSGAKVEPSVAGDAAETRYQFERVGYFVGGQRRLAAGDAAVQPHGDLAGYLGEDKGQIVAPAARTHASCCSLASVQAAGDSASERRKCMSDPMVALMSPPESGPIPSEPAGARQVLARLHGRGIGEGANAFSVEASARGFRSKRNRDPRRWELGPLRVDSVSRAAGLWNAAMWSRVRTVGSCSRARALKNGAAESRRMWAAAIWDLATAILD